MLNDLQSPLTLLASRRSGKPRDMIAPGPSAEQLAIILNAAMRVPDHGKLAPWRFIVVEHEQRAALGLLLANSYRQENPGARLSAVESIEQFAHQAPTLIVVVSTPVAGVKIPVWEQELSAGAACMNLLIAAHAQGFVGSWLTDWPAYSDTVRDAFADAPARIAGFIFIGTASRELQERPRPTAAAVVKRWTPAH